MSVALRGRPGWVETYAVVSECRFQFARMNTLTLGIQTGEKFRVRFDYYAFGRLCSGEYQSPVAVAQGERLRITFNPLKPQENSLSGGGGMSGSRRGSLIGLGIGGSIVLSLLWLAMIHGCR